MPIAEISPYMNKWTVKARIASRSQLRSFQRKGGGAEGKVFHVEIVDAGGGEIRASFFDKAAVGHYELLQVGKVFTFSSKGAQVKIANRQYNTTNSRYELTFDKGAEIMESSGEIAPVPVVFAFTDLRAVQALRALPCRVDVVGVVKEFRPVGTVRTKEGKELAKRDIIIADDTSSSMKVTLWSKIAERPDTDFEGTPTIALKGVLLKEWNGGRDGSLGDSSVILLNPEGLPEAARIQQWWSQGGKSQNLTPLGASGGAGGAAKNAQRVSVSEMRRNAELVSDKPSCLQCLFGWLRCRPGSRASKYLCTTTLAPSQERGAHTSATKKWMRRATVPAASGQAGRRCVLPCEAASRISGTAPG